MLTNIYNAIILVFHEKSKRDGFGSKLDVTVYRPGWMPQQKLTRPEVRALLKAEQGVRLIHLDAKCTHFSAIIHEYRPLIEDLDTLSPRAAKRACRSKDRVKL